MEEGILAGGSCGMAAHGALQVAAEDHDALVVVILPDSGRGYLSRSSTTTGLPIGASRPDKPRAPDLGGPSFEYQLWHCFGV